MAMLYADENFSQPVVDALRALGHDVLTALDVGQANQKIPDAQVLAHATALDRAVLTTIGGITFGCIVPRQHTQASSCALMTPIRMRWPSGFTTR